MEQGLLQSKNYYESTVSHFRGRTGGKSATNTPGGLTKTDFRMLFKPRNVFFTFNITSFFFNETYINMMKRINHLYYEPSSENEGRTTCPRIGRSTSTIFFKTQ